METHLHEQIVRHAEEIVSRDPPSGDFVSTAALVLTDDHLSDERKIKLAEQNLRRSTLRLRPGEYYRRIQDVRKIAEFDSKVNQLYKMRFNGTQES